MKGEREEADTPAKPTDYVIIGNLRLVQPYFFDFKCFVKERWHGKRLVDLFTSEFPVLSRSYYERAAAAGRLRVEAPSKGRFAGQAPPPDIPLASGMCVRHLVHRHEPPVLTGTVEVLAQTSDFVAVLKPACMPVHTVGQYRKNTVLGVLQAEHPELGRLMPTYRLDKPVSGLLLLARSSEAAGSMRKQLEERQCRKAYVARVQGYFPATDTELASAAQGNPHTRVVEWEGSMLQQGLHPEQHNMQAQTGRLCLEVDVPLDWDAKTNHVSAIPEGTLSRNSSKAGGKGPCHACTQFRLLWRDPEGKTSVVECRPKTGRTHQIRVHLQFLGHPIANDTQYGGTFGAPLAFRLTRQQPQPGTRTASTGASDTCAAPGTCGATVTDCAGTATQQRSSATGAPPQHDGTGAALGPSNTTIACAGGAACVSSGPAQVSPCNAPVLAPGSSSSCTALSVAQPSAALVWGHTSVGFQRSGQRQASPVRDGRCAQPSAQGGCCAQEGSCAQPPAHPCHTLPHAVLLPPMCRPEAAPTAERSGGLQQDGHGCAAQEPTDHLQGGRGCDAQGVAFHAQGSSKRPRRGGSPTPLAGTAPCEGQQDSPAPAAAAGGMVAGDAHTQVGQTSERAPPVLLTHAAAADEGTLGAARASDVAAPVDAQLQLFPMLRTLYHDPLYRVEPERQETVCPHCPGLVPRGYPIDLEPLWLHALRYSSPNWSFEAPMPAWADVAFVAQPLRESS